MGQDLRLPAELVLENEEREDDTDETLSEVDGEGGKEVLLLVCVAVDTVRKQQLPVNK